MSATRSTRLTVPVLPLLFACITACAPHVRPAAPPSVGPDTSTDVRSLPIVELRAAQETSPTLTIILSGDGGWADIDRKVGEQLRARGVDVIGLDMRGYLRGGGGPRTPASLAADISRIARRYGALWQRPALALVGYSRGSDLAPFAANRLAPDVRPRLRLVAFLALLERASFAYHFSDLWRTTSGKHDIPILPEIEQLHADHVPMLCVYGKEESESLCRTAPPGLMTVVERPGGHHFDKNYTLLADLVYDMIVHTAPQAVTAAGH